MCYTLLLKILGTLAVIFIMTEFMIKTTNKKKLGAVIYKSGYPVNIHLLWAILFGALTFFEYSFTKISWSEPMPIFLGIITVRNLIISFQKCSIRENGLVSPLNSWRWEQVQSYKYMFEEGKTLILIFELEERALFRKAKGTCKEVFDIQTNPTDTKENILQFINEKLGQPREAK